MEEYEREQAEKKKPKPFAGAGNSIRGGTVAAEQSPTSRTENHHTIHLWRNGIRFGSRTLAARCVLLRFEMGRLLCINLMVHGDAAAAATTDLSTHTPTRKFLK